MDRRKLDPRPDWQEKVERQGLLWHTPEGTPYWDEGAYYEFSPAEIKVIERATETVYGLFLEAGDRIVSDPKLMALLGIPEYCRDAVSDAWEQEPPSLNYGRFDFGYNGSGEPKLFEFNCDTPTSMLETGVIQWTWKEDVFPHLDQFNSLHEKLIARWAEIGRHCFGGRAWFTHVADPLHEDTLTTTYMRDLAEQAGLETHGVVIDDIALDASGRILDHEDRVITTIFKLYPWEWIVAEPFGRAVAKNLPSTIWIEPIWKMIWSNKNILPLLWELFPGHPNLLQSSLDQRSIGSDYVVKPALAREGANVAVVQDGRTVAQTDGGYEGEPVIYQRRYPLKDYGNGYPVLGCWVVDGSAAGMGIREDGLITSDRARFIPHVIRD